MARRPVSFETACKQYPHRYTMEYMPAWALKPCESNGKYYAPQFRTDLEWYENTTFPGEKGWSRHEDHCLTSGQTWPMGNWLDAPYARYSGRVST